MTTEINKEFEIRNNKLNLIGLDFSHLVSFNGPISGGVNVDFENGVYELYYSDKNGRNSILTTMDMWEALFTLFKVLTHRAAFEFELEHRIESQDYRIIAFQKHIEILEGLELGQKQLNDLKRRYNQLLSMRLFDVTP